MLGYFNHLSTHSHPVSQLSQYFIYATLYQFIFFPYIVQDDLFFSMDPKHGVFGWLSNPYDFFMVLFFVSPLTGILTNFGFFTSYKYFPMQVIAACILFEPFLGQVAGIILGQDEIPGPNTVIGLLSTSAGFMLASYGGTLKERETIKRILNESITVGDDLNEHLLDPKQKKETY